MKIIPKTSSYKNIAKNYFLLEQNEASKSLDTGNIPILASTSNTSIEKSNPRKRPGLQSKSSTKSVDIDDPTIKYAK